MIRSSKRRVPFGVLAVSGVTLLGATLLAASHWGATVLRVTLSGTDPSADPSADRGATREMEPAVWALSVAVRQPHAKPSSGPPVATGSPEVDAERSDEIADGVQLRDALNHAPRASGASLVAMLPPSLVELARSTTWDRRTVEALEQFMLLAFDADGNGLLDDFERIMAVRSLRDATWPTGHGELDGPATDFDDGAPVARVGAASLSRADLLLHHDADESRRLGDASDAGDPARAGEFEAELHGLIIQRFQLDDDGLLALDEYARFVRVYSSGSEFADLNLDGLVDDADLRLFLDVASPIEGQ